MLHPMVLVQKNVSQDSYNFHLVNVTFRCNVNDSQKQLWPWQSWRRRTITCL